MRVGHFKTMKCEITSLTRCTCVQVDYSCHSWLLKNMDPLNENVVSLLQGSQDDFLRMIWKDGQSVTCYCACRSALAAVGGTVFVVNSS